MFVIFLKHSPDQVPLLLQCVCCVSIRSFGDKQQKVPVASPNRKAADSDLENGLEPREAQQLRVAPGQPG